MYTGFFNMKFDPFIPMNILEQPFEADFHIQLKKRLEFLSKTKGFGLITGTSGSGKTFGIHHWKKNLDKNLFYSAYVSLTTTTINDFYRHLCHSLEVIPGSKKIDMFNQIQKRIEQLYRMKKVSTVIIIDDAHMLRNEILLELPLIFNFSQQGITPYIVILISHPFVRDKLRVQSFEVLRTRINMFFEIPMLALKETTQYINHLTTQSGAIPDLFCENVSHVIHEVSGGSIRVINNICHHVLLAAYAKKQSIIDVHDIEIAANELILD